MFRPSLLLLPTLSTAKRESKLSGDTESQGSHSGKGCATAAPISAATATIESVNLDIIISKGYAGASSSSGSHSYGLAKVHSGDHTTRDTMAANATMSNSAVEVGGRCVAVACVSADEMRFDEMVGAFQQGSGKTTAATTIKII